MDIICFAFLAYFIWLVFPFLLLLRGHFPWISCIFPCIIEKWFLVKERNSSKIFHTQSFIFRFNLKIHCHDEYNSAMSFSRSELTYWNKRCEFLLPIILYRIQSFDGSSVPALTWLLCAEKQSAFTAVYFYLSKAQNHFQVLHLARLSVCSSTVFF